MFHNVLFVLDEFIAYSLLGIGCPSPQLRHTVDHISDEDVSPLQ